MDLPLTYPIKTVLTIVARKFVGPQFVNKTDFYDMEKALSMGYRMEMGPPPPLGAGAFVASNISRAGTNKNVWLSSRKERHRYVSLPPPPSMKSPVASSEKFQLQRKHGQRRSNSPPIRPTRAGTPSKTGMALICSTSLPPKG